MFTFCPLQGALSDSTASQSLLELDGGVKILISVGWDESFDPEKLRELEKQVPTLSLILLTHATVAHLGAYAHCCKNLPLFTRIPVYATRPVIDLGRNLMQDMYASTPLAATTISPDSLAEASCSYSYSYSSARDPSAVDDSFLLQAPTSDDIARYFSLIQPLKYSQPHQPLPSPFSPPLNGLTITAYNAGHSLGGTIWHIQHGLESIVYAVDWNQNRDNVLAGAAWPSGGHGAGGTEVLEQLRKPTALICSSRTPESPLPRARRDELLLESLKLCVGRGGTALIPVDSSARVLELAYVLEHAWRTECASHDSVLKSTRLYLASRNVSTTMRNARSMLEWMDENMVREFEATDGFKKTRGNEDGSNQREAGPFDFKYLRLLDRKAQVEHVLREAASDGGPQGKVILASDSSLDWGFSKDILQSIASDARNLVVLTEKPNMKPNPLGHTLWQWWKERREGVATEQAANGSTFEQVYGGGRELDMTMASRRALEGSELGAYQQWLATQRQLQATLQNAGSTSLGATADAVDDASSESSESDESDAEQQGKALNVATTMGQASRKKVVLKDQDLGINILLKRKGVYDFDVRGKKGRERMFPVAVRRKRNDNYGELIRPEDYLRAEEREEVDGHDGPQDRPDREPGLGKKRKWDDVGTAARASATAKRPHSHRRLSGQEAETAALVEGPGAEELDQLEDTEEKMEGPCKLAIVKESVKVNLRLAFVDFSGLHDKRSLHMLIPLIQPRKLILVGGNAGETQVLAADCRKLLAAQLGAGEREKSAIDVFTPAVGTSINASVDTSAWSVKLSESLVKRLKWQKVRGLGIVTLTGMLVRQDADGRTLVDAKPEGDEDDGAAADDDGGAHKRQKTDDGCASAPPSTALVPAGRDRSRAVEALPRLEVLPPNMVSAVRSAAQPLHVGDLRLADLRRAMLGAGHTAEFRGEGTLLVDGTVAVRKSTTGRVEVESVALPVAVGRENAAGGTFYAVRRKIYENLAVVAGGVG